MARGQFRWLGLAAVVALLAGCGGPSAGDPARADATPTSAAGASASPAVGAPYEFADAKGFRYSLSIVTLGTAVENVVGVAPPGQAYPIFSATLTNLQQDRSAPWPQFTTLSVLTFAVPESKLVKGSADSWNCSKPGVTGCILGITNLTCFQLLQGGDVRKMSVLDDPIRAGATVEFSCSGPTPILTPGPTDLRLYLETSERKIGVPATWQELPRPPQS